MRGFTMINVQVTDDNAIICQQAAYNAVKELTPEHSQD